MYQPQSDNTLKCAVAVLRTNTWCVEGRCGYHTCLLDPQTAVLLVHIVVLSMILLICVSKFGHCRCSTLSILTVHMFTNAIEFHFLYSHYLFIR